ncbi:MAG: hypothetical protein IJ257_05650 [Treponema sp.]|nr:hypothetical protein [Treponema sp.]
MLQNSMNKKTFLFAILCVFAVGFMFAQSAATEKLINDRLTKAADCLDNGQFKDAYNYVNSTLLLSNKDELPGRVILVAQQTYRKFLENMSKTGKFDDFEDVLMRVQAYPKIGEDPQVQKFIKIIQQQQVDAKEAARDAKTHEMMENLSKSQQAGNEEILKSINESNESMINSVSDKMNTAIESVGEKTATAVREVSEHTTNTMREISKTSNKTIWIIAILGGLIFVIVFILVFIGIKTAQRNSALQAEQLDSTLKLIAGMQQANNQLLLGGVTDLNGMGLKSAGSSRWGVDALPAPEMNDDEKAELKQLVIDCEKLGSEIDAVTKRKNNSKNVSELVYKLSMQLGLNQNSSMIYFAASMVYDAGFLAVPEELLEAESLTPEQREQLRDHVNLYEQYMGFVPRKYWDIFEDAAKYHHENTDGSGYHGLSGEDIPQIARLIHVAESYNSLISRRNYKQIMDKETAIQELESKPNLYDIEVVKVLDSIV